MGFLHHEEGGATIKMDEKYGKETVVLHQPSEGPGLSGSGCKGAHQHSNGPKTVAIAYEDSSYGADNFRFAENFFAESGLKIVLSEPFKSRASDYAPLITKVKDVNPDVFYFIAIREMPN